MYRIRFHGRGGQGVKTASRILGSALFHSGYEVQDAPRYGAERRGAPIFAFVRASGRAIHERGVIHVPDLVVVIDDTLPTLPQAGVLEGVGATTALLLHSARPPAEWKRLLKHAGPLLTFAHSGKQARGLTAAVGAGAAARLLGIVPKEALRAAILDELGPLGADTVAMALEAVLPHYDRLTAEAGCVTEAPADKALTDLPAWVVVPRDPVALATSAIFASGNSTAVPTGLWRTERPVLDPERCKHCWWICGTFCPDNAIRVSAAGAPEFDYVHCKGCMICQTQCPSDAIVSVPEHDALYAEQVRGTGEAAMHCAPRATSRRKRSGATAGTPSQRTPRHGAGTSQRTTGRSGP